MARTVLYTNANSISEMRVPLAFQVSAARDFCSRSNVSLPTAQDEIYKSDFPYVLFSLLSDSSVSTIFVPALWFIEPLLKTNFQPVFSSEKAFLFYLQEGRIKHVNSVISELRSANRIANYISYY